MQEAEVKQILIEKLKFSKLNIEQLDYYHLELLEYNKKYNLISKSTESEIWTRHILDSAQLLKFINFQSGYSLADLGSGAGFPGLVIAIFALHKGFHVKLYEKSPVKQEFLNRMIKNIDIDCKVIGGNCNDEYIDAEYITARAFKKLEKIMTISREIAKKPHKILILKGKSAQVEADNALKNSPFKYKLVDSITDKQSKIVLIDVLKSD